jgi:catechol 2,3-dioxygenase-like lactoylglutathione lyase family enzyme
MTAGHPESLSAVTLGVTDMAASCGFYESLGFARLYGGPDAAFTSYAVGPSYLNLQLVAETSTRWGRFIVHVDDVDAIHERAVAAGLRPSMPPSDAPWGERYFHIDDPDGHELSVARPLR